MNKPVSALASRLLSAGLALLTAAGLAAGCRGLAPMSATGQEAPTARVDVVVKVPAKKAPELGLSRGVLAIDHTRTSSVSLYTTGAGQNYGGGWLYHTAISFSAADANGIRSAAFPGLAVQAGPRRIFLARVHDLGGEVQQEIWGVADVPATQTVVLDPYTTPTAKVFRELLLTGDPERAKGMAIADVQTLVDTLLNTNRAASPAAPIDGSKPMMNPIHLYTEPLALAIANGPRVATDTFTPYVVPTPSAENGLVPSPLRQAKLTVKILDSLGQPFTGSAAIAIDDPLTDMVHVAADASGASATFDPMPITFTPQDVGGGLTPVTWTLDVVGDGRADRGTFTIANQENKTIYLSMPLKTTSEAVLGGPGGGPFPNYPLQKSLNNPRHPLVASDAVYWIESSGLGDRLYSVDFKDEGAQAKKLQEGGTCGGVAFDEWGNPIYARTDWVNAPWTPPVYQAKVWKIKHWKEDPLASGVRVPDDGSTAIMVDCNQLTGWGNSVAGTIAYDKAARKLILSRGATGAGNAVFVVNMDVYATNPAGSSSAWGVTHNSPIAYRDGFVFYGYTWRYQTGPDRWGGAIYRYDIANARQDTVVGKQLINAPESIRVPGLTLPAPLYIAGGGTLPSITTDRFGNLYFTSTYISGSTGVPMVARVANALEGTDAANEWLATDMRFNASEGLWAGGVGMCFDPDRDLLYYFAGNKLRRVKLE